MNRFLFCLMSILILSNGYSQDSIMNRFKCKLYTGAFISVFSDFKPYNTSEKKDFSRTGRVAIPLGFSVDYFMSKSMYFEFGVLFSPKGGAFSKSSTNTILITNKGSEDAKIVNIFKLNYIEFPFLVKSAFPDLPVAIYTGFSINYLLSSEFKYNEYVGSFNNTSENWHDEPLENVKKVNCDLIIGIDFTLAIERFKYHPILCLRYNRGLMKVFNVDKIDNVESKVFYNNFGILIGFPL